MGILQKLIDRKAQTLSIGTKAPTADDKDGITQDVWDFLCPKPFSIITKTDIENALDAAFPLVKAEALLEKLKTADQYKKSSKADFEKLFKEILTDPDLKTVKAPKALNKIRPGGLIGGGVHGPGSIGGFLTNDKSEIFLFGDAHVMVKTINVAITSTTPQVQLTHGIVKNNVEIGVVVCSGSVQVGGQENYDLALAKIKSEYCKNIDLQYRGGKNQKDTKTFFVTDVDDNLVDGKKVFLFGHSSGFREGKLQLSKPTSVSEAPYGNFIGEKDDQKIAIHGCIKVQSTGGDAASLGGDSGGLWVNETGEAVGIQLMAGGDFAWLHPMRLVMDYFKKHYDGSLRFLKPNDLAKTLLDI